MRPSPSASPAATSAGPATSTQTSGTWTWHCFPPPNPGRLGGPVRTCFPQAWPRPPPAYSREESRPHHPKLGETPEGEAALAQCGWWAGREMRRPRSGAAPQAGCRSDAVGARRPEAERPALPRLREGNFAGPSTVLRSPWPAPWRAAAGGAPLRQGLARSPGAGPRRHGLVGAGAGRRAVRPAGGAARPRRSLF